MIEIIKAGTKKKIGCKECGSVLSYEEEDVQVEDNSQCNRFGGVKRYITCPVCNKDIILSQTR